MCWSAEASVAMVVVGAVATSVTYQRGEPPAIWGTIAYFTGMEALQVAGYLVIDDCGSTANTGVTVLSYLHIVFQPLIINLFAMELIPEPVKHRVRTGVLALCWVSISVMLVQLLPLHGLGRCVPGFPLCGDAFCTASGTWHIAWNVPYNSLLVPVETALGTRTGFPTYVIAAFVLPLFYGAWRFALASLLFGPVLASVLTSNPNEMPAVWCLFSIAILFISLSPLVRRSVSARTWWGVAV